jgi:hypothetical protein
LRFAEWKFFPCYNIFFHSAKIELCHGYFVLLMRVYCLVILCWPIMVESRLHTPPGSGNLLP